MPVARKTPPGFIADLPMRRDRLPVEMHGKWKPDRSASSSPPTDPIPAPEGPNGAMAAALSCALAPLATVQPSPAGSILRDNGLCETRRCGAQGPASFRDQRELPLHLEIHHLDGSALWRA